MWKRRQREILEACKEDCFHCPFPDCILNTITPKGSEDAKRRNDLLFPKTERHARRREYYRKDKARYHDYYMAHKNKKAANESTSPESGSQK